MAKTNHFQAFNLHPGQHTYTGFESVIGGGGRIKFGPAPNGAEDFYYGFKINMPQSKILPFLLWNPKSWNTQLNATLNFSRDSSIWTLYHSFTGSLSGKFIYAYGRMRPDYAPLPQTGLIRSTNAPPSQRVSGICDKYYTFTGETDNNDAYYYTIPEPTVEIIGDDESDTLSLTVNDKTGVQSGQFSSSGSISSIRNGSPLFSIQGTASVTIHEIYLRDDGTADVIAYIECAVYGGGSVLMYQSVPPGYSDLGSYTINFLGVTVPCHLVIFGAIPSGMNVSAFSFSYAVTVSERWTY